MERVLIKSPKSLVPLFSVPIVLVTSINADFKPNIMTAGWVGVACSEPQFITLAIRPTRYTYHLIKQSGEFAINIPTTSMLKKVDYCGIYSGRNVDKFKDTDLTPMPAKLIHTPIIDECPVNLECRVHSVIPLGTHDLFIAEVLICQASCSVILNNGVNHSELSFRMIDPIVANYFEYWNLGKNIGTVYKEHNEDQF